MGKYRVLQQSKSSFKPQWKGWFFWRGFVSNIYAPETAFAHKGDAISFIENYINEHETQNYPKVVQEWA